MVSGSAQLKDWMHRRRFLQRETAEYLDCDVSFISQLLRGARVPGLGNAILIERKTGIPVEAWLPKGLDESVECIPVGAAKVRRDKA